MSKQTFEEWLDKEAQIYADRPQSTYALGQKDEAAWARRKMNFEAGARLVQDRAEVLEWALKRAVDLLSSAEHSSICYFGDAKAQVLKILKDNGLEYDATGHLTTSKG